MALSCTFVCAGAAADQEELACEAHHSAAVLRHWCGLHPRQAHPGRRCVRVCAHGALHVPGHACHLQRRSALPALQVSAGPSHPILIQPICVLYIVSLCSELYCTFLRTGAETFICVVVKHGLWRYCSKFPACKGHFPMPFSLQITRTASGPTAVVCPM